MLHDLNVLAEWLKAHHPSEIVMPCASNKKSPRFRHAHGAWTWDAASWQVCRARAGQPFGVLLQKLCVVDVDSQELADALEKRFPVLLEVPCEHTARGRHYIFSRSPLCDAGGFFDGANQVITGIDFKTVCSTGSAGFVVVAPSQKRAWVRTPWSTAVRDIPDALLRAIATPKYTCSTMQLQVAGDLIPVCGGALIRLPYVQLFTQSEGPDALASAGTHVVPLPNEFTRADAVCIAKAYTRGVPDYTPTDQDITGVGVRAHAQRALALLDFLGAPRAHLDAIDRVAREMARAADICPRLARTVASFEMVDVPCKCALVAAPRGGQCSGADPVLDAAAVFREHVKRGPNIGTDPMLVHDPAASVWAALPARIRALMMKHRGRVFVAGGFILACLIADDTLPCSDVDVYLVGCSLAQANTILTDFREPGCQAFVSGSAVTITYDVESALPVQVVLLLADSPEAVLDNFDMEPSRVGAFVDQDNQLRVVSSAAWLPCVQQRIFPLTSRRWSRSATFRSLKLATRGFQPFIAGLDRARARRQLRLFVLPIVHGMLTSAANCTDGAREVIYAEMLLRHASNPLRTLARLRPLMPTSGYLESLPSKAWGRIARASEWIKHRLMLWTGAVSATPPRKRGSDGSIEHETVAWRFVPRFGTTFAFYPVDMRLDELLLPNLARPLWEPE